MVTANICPDELEFAEGIELTKKICACASQKDCVAVITGVDFPKDGDGNYDIPQYIRDQIQVTIDDKVASIKSNLANANNPDKPLFNYQVEIQYQKPLITTNEVADKVLKEHVEKLKNDEGIKGIAEVLSKLEAQFPTNPVKPISPKVENVTNPLVKGTEISRDDINNIKVNFTKATDTLKSINYNYLRPDFKNTSDSKVIKYVSREFNKFVELYNTEILPKFTEVSKEDAKLKIDTITTIINININAVSNTGTPLSNNFDDADRFSLRTNIIELNNILVGVYTAYTTEFDKGILASVLNNLDSIITTKEQCL